MPASFKFPDGRREFWTPLAPASATAGGRPESLLVMAPSSRRPDHAGGPGPIEASTVDARTAQGTTAARPLRIAPSLVRHLNPPVARDLPAGRRGRVRAAHRLRQPRQPAARPECQPLARGRRPDRPRRVTRHAHPSVPDRIAAARGARRSPRPARWRNGRSICSSRARRGELTYLQRERHCPRRARRGLRDCADDHARASCCRRAASHQGVARRRAGRAQGRRAGAPPIGPGQARMRSAFVVLQLAVSVVLLVGAALLARTFIAAHARQPRFRRAQSLDA